MNKKLIIFLMLGVLLISGCETFGYEDKWETDRRLCKKCISSCPNWDFISNYDGREYTEDEYNNLTEVKEYRSCYNEKCKWICER